jgi:ketosteroid isomerase-like protein
VARYLALHDPDFIWVRADEAIIEGLAEYGARIRESFANLPAGITVHLAFRFTERIAGAGMASERGIARMSGTGPRGPLPARYTRFHTIARHGDGRWRLLVDYEGGTADEADFDAAYAVEDLTVFK